MNPRRSLLSAPLTVASAIAARTRRIGIGTAVQILPLGHPLRLAEETATIDQISGGRLIFGVGRSAFPRAYDAYGISYEESEDRFAESLDIIKKAWTEPNISHRGRYFSFENFTLVPRPVQQPHPPIRIAASRPGHLCGDRGARLPAVFGSAGEPLVAARGADPGLSRGLGNGRPSGAGPGLSSGADFVGETRAAAFAEAEKGMMQFSSYRADLQARPDGLRRGIARKGHRRIDPQMVVERLEQLREEAQLDGVSAEINPGSMFSHQQVMKSLRLYCEEVMPHFK